MIEIPPEQRVQVSSNGIIINVETWSGWRSASYDDKGESSILRNPTKAEIVGEAVARALAASRMIHSDKLGPFLDLKNVAQRLKDREAGLMAAHGCTTRRTLYKKMRLVFVNKRENDNIITITSTVKYQLDGFEGDDFSPIILPETASNEKLGLAVLEALARSK